MKGSKKEVFKVGGKKLEISNPDKVLFPKSKITKKDLITYYQKIAKYMLPFMKDRPISMKRYPNGINQEGFFQKNVSDFFPKWIETVSVKREGKEKIKMMICNDAISLCYLANLACITPHIWLSKKNSLNSPDRMIFDLDPNKKDFSSVKEAAFLLKEILDKRRMKSYVMTTGSKGLHVIVFLRSKTTFEKTRKKAKEIAKELVEKDPKKFTIESRKSKRKNKVYIDYLRNGYAQTAVAPYSVRAKENAPVAVPISWKELKSKGINAQSYNIMNVFKLLNKRKNPW